MFELNSLVENFIAMKRPKGTLFLYNGLYAISSNFKELEHLESSVFEVFDEIDSCIETGFSDQSISHYLDSGIVGNDLGKELTNFRDHVSAIDSEYWNPYDFDNNEDWKLARQWASSLMKQLGMKKNGWDDSGTTVVYLDDE